MSLENRWRLAPLALIAVSGTVCLWGLGATSLGHGDEVLHAGLTWSMSEELGLSARFLPHGALYFGKPPLLHWLGAIAIWALGPSELAVRLVPALCAIGLVCVLYVLGSPVVGRLAAFLGALVLATMFPFVYIHCARAGVSDALLLLPFTAALLLFPRALRSRRRMIAASALLGVACMAKHLVFGALGLAIAAVYLLVTGRWRAVSPRLMLIGALTFTVIAAPWHVAMTARHGSAFWSSYAGTHVVRRFHDLTMFHTPRERDLRTPTPPAPPVPGATPAPPRPRPPTRNDHPWYFFVAVVKHLTFPWFLLIPLAALYCLRRESRRSRSKGHILIGIAALTCFLAFSAAQVRYTWYVLPAFPFFALLTGKLLADLLRWRTSPVFGVLGLGAALAHTCWASQLASSQNIYNTFPLLRPVALVRSLASSLSLDDQALAVAIPLLAGGVIWMVVGRFKSLKPIVAVSLALPLLVTALWTVVGPLRYVDRTSCAERAAAWVRENTPRARPVRLPRRRSGADQDAFWFYFQRALIDRETQFGRARNGRRSIVVSRRPTTRPLLFQCENIYVFDRAEPAPPGI